MEPGLVLVGLTAAVTSSSLAATVAQASTDPGPLTSYTSAGATATAVAALAYVTRQLVAGNLVAKSSAKTEADQAEAIANLTRIIEEANKREDHLYDFITRGQSE